MNFVLTTLLVAVFALAFLASVAIVLWYIVRVLMALDVWVNRQLREHDVERLVLREIRRQLGRQKREERKHGT